MKKIRSGATGLVAAVVGVAAAVALICAGCNDGGIADEDGTAGRFIYRFYVVELGGNKWMKKNLDVETADSWCYNDNPYLCEMYGRLYTWEAAKSACQRIGWRLPTKSEWEALIDAAGNYQVAGKKLKAKSGWYSWYDLDDLNGTDDFGFSALPGGVRSGCYDDDGGFGFCDARYVGSWWTATEDKDDHDGYYENKDDHAYCVFMDPNGHSANVSGGSTKGYGLSVRCVLDD